MTADDWKKKLDELGHRYSFKIREGIDEASLLEAEGVVGRLPDDLRSFYLVTNGLRYEWFNILPIEQRTNINETWDGLKRANNKLTTRFLGRSDELLRKFLIFAEIGGGHCACISRKDSFIWFQDADGIHETELTLPELLESSLREVAEL